MATDGQRAVAQLADQLTDGFIALSEEYRLLREQHRQLGEQLTWAKKQHQELLRRFTPDTADDEYAVFLDDLVEAGNGTSNSHSDWLERLSENPTDGRSGRAFLIRQAELANETLKQIAESKEAVGVRIWNGPSADKEPANGNSSPRSGGSEVNGNTEPTEQYMEKDFTIAGTPSKLECPFAQANGPNASFSEKHSLVTPRSSVSKLSPNAIRSKRSSFNDPIRAAIKGVAEELSAEPSVEGSGGVCPIRFLDQHSPEEVAQYFETHKHDLPRSHEICIKRFQSNSEQIRQLDAKYGNLVSMIQGLGQKHQPWLPDKPSEDEEAVEQDEASDKVKNWAEAVNASLKEGETGNLADGIDAVPTTVEDDAREPHFDRPLKEVRVGESPSRPWGITVPAKYVKASGGSSTHSPATASPPDRAVPTVTVRPSHCPFDHSKLRAQVSDLPDSEPKDGLPIPPSATSPAAEQANKTSYGGSTKPVSSPPQMVFTGPVFIGYSPDMIQQFLGQGTAKAP